MAALSIDSHWWNKIRVVLSLPLCLTQQALSLSLYLPNARRSRMAIKLLVVMAQKSLIVWNAIHAKTQKEKKRKPQSASWDVKKQNQITNENKKYGEIGDVQLDHLLTRATRAS
jgi:uncharacterized membrane protein YfhO